MPDASGIIGDSWLNPKAELRSSPLEGMGLFARRKIKAGERVVIFGGQIMRIKELNGLPENLQNYPFQIEERFVLGARRGRVPPLPYRFNHSCDPNCGFKGQIFMVAMRDIDRNEELTVDYAMLVAKSVGSRIKFEMSCDCGTRRCRGYITENDWKNPALQRRYRGYFSSYIEEKIDALRSRQRSRP